MTKRRDDIEGPSSTWSLTSPGSEADPGWSGDAPEIEGYEITGVLGYGAMGTVWSAVQLSTGREVALKFLGRGAFASQKARAYFEREVRLTARLQHPNIARIYDSGLHQGVYYYAMELIDGVDLDTYAGDHLLTQRQIVGLMTTVCKAIEHAHQHGVIHRDLKPSNILVTPDGQPHVVDFGLAKAFLEKDPATTLSTEGEITGTPAYMAPEQAAGHVGQVDARTDVYSLGVILYRLLTGEPPHDLSGKPHEILHRIVEEEVKRPREVSRAIDRELEAVLLKAIARQPDSRYSSAADLARDLENYMRGKPLMARPLGVMHLLRRATRKYAVPAAISATGLVLLGLRFSGNLQALELNAYDTLLPWRLHSSVPEPPITVIGITENDIRSLGHYPLTDEELARLLDDIAAKGARTIGLDIYRDLEVAPGRSELNAVLSEHPEIIAVMKLAVSDPGVPPPDILTDSPERIGFADQVIDPDGIIRRGLLFASDDEATYYSLSLQLALSYLQPLGILPQPDKKNPEHLRLGSVTIRPFESSDGAYVNADAAGYQFLLDYRGPTRFRTFSLGDVKSGRVGEQAIKDKIVLVGVMAASMKDYVDIPVKSNLYGVEMQAICADQLLRIALHGQRPIRVLSNWQENLWIVACIALGGLLGFSAHSTRMLFLTGGIGLAAIGATAYVLFCLGWWIPVVPPLMGGVVAWLLAGLHQSRKRRRV